MEPLLMSVGSLTAPLTNPASNPLGFAAWIGAIVAAFGGILRMMGYGPGGTKPYSQFATDVGAIIRNFWKGDTVVENVAMTTFEKAFAFLIKVLIEQEGLPKDEVKKLEDTLTPLVQERRRQRFSDAVDAYCDSAGKEPAPLKSSAAPEPTEKTKSGDVPILPPV